MDKKQRFGKSRKEMINQEGIREISSFRDYEVTRHLHYITFFLLMLLVMLTIGAILLMIPLKEEMQNQGYGKADIYDSVLRFHVRANSDSEEDQNVKLKVKEAVLNQVQEYLPKKCTKEETMAILKEHLSELLLIAEDTLEQYGYNYGVTGYFTTEQFPVKRYGDLTFPAGIYDALRIDLGAGKGHNWWCMIYPSLCFVDATYGVVPEDSKEELKGVLAAEDYEELLADPDTEVELHSAFLDKCRELYDRWIES